MSGQLNDIQINNILSSQIIGRLACTDGMQPCIVPSTFTYDGEYIYGQTNEGTKLDLLRKNPNACFEVDGMTDMWNWQSVVVYGIFEELKGKEAAQSRKFFIDRVYPLMTGSSIHKFGHEEFGIVDQNTTIKQVMYRIKIRELTGRSKKNKR